MRSLFFLAARGLKHPPPSSEKDKGVFKPALVEDAFVLYVDLHLVESNGYAKGNGHLPLLLAIFTLVPHISTLRAMTHQTDCLSTPIRRLAARGISYIKVACSPDILHNCTTPSPRGTRFPPVPRPAVCLRPAFPPETRCALVQPGSPAGSTRRPPLDAPGVLGYTCVFIDLRSDQIEVGRE